ncbi:site-specific integrase [Streptomyces mirabilis]
MAGVRLADWSELFERRRVPTGTPILLDEAMRPVEPLSSWFRVIGQRGLDVKTMRAYAYTVLMLLNFLTARGLDLRLTTENDVLEFRRWRREDAEETVGETTWDRDAAAIGGLYDYLAQVGYVSGRPWRATGRGESLGSGVSRDPRVRHMELDQVLFCRDVGFGGLEPGGGLDLGFRGWRPHRNRSALELALMTGMRIQEWSTLLLPELGLTGGCRPTVADVDLAACAKYGRPRSVYVPRDAMELLEPYLLLERPRSDRHRHPPRRERRPRRATHQALWRRRPTASRPSRVSRLEGQDRQASTCGRFRACTALVAPGAGNLVRFARRLRRPGLLALLMSRETLTRTAMQPQDLGDQHAPLRWTDVIDQEVPSHLRLRRT